MNENKMGSQTKLSVRYAETDTMGVVHHANYYIYFEVAREDLIRECGISYREMEETGIMMPLVETQCKYYQPAKYADNLLIKTEVSQLAPAKIVIEYTVTREHDGVLIAKGKTVQAFVDKETFRLISLKKANPSLWEKMNQIFVSC